MPAPPLLFAMQLGDRVYALDTNTDSHGVLRVQSTTANGKTGWAKVMHSDGTPNLEFVGGSAILSSRSDAVDTDGIAPALSPTHKHFIPLLFVMLPKYCVSSTDCCS